MRISDSGLPKRRTVDFLLERLGQPAVVEQPGQAIHAGLGLRPFERPGVLQRPGQESESLRPRQVFHGLGGGRSSAEIEDALQLPVTRQWGADTGSVAIAIGVLGVSYAVSAVRLLDLVGDQHAAGPSHGHHQVVAVVVHANRQVDLPRVVALRQAEHARLRLVQVERDVGVAQAGRQAGNQPAAQLRQRKLLKLQQPDGQIGAALWRLVVRSAFDGWGAKRHAGPQNLQHRAGAGLADEQSRRQSGSRVLC
jgi:hypothetical protein